VTTESESAAPSSYETTTTGIEADTEESLTSEEEQGEKRKAENKWVSVTTKVPELATV
jgi:hypothetical protein